MSIFGTQTITSTAQSSTFYCPQCSAEKPYKYNKVKSYLSVFSKPFIPLSTKVEYVECQSCSNTFVKQVLNRENLNEEFHSEFQKAVKRVLILMILADEVVGESEIESFINVYEKFTKIKMSKDEVKSLIETVKAENQTLNEYLFDIKDQLNDLAKEMILQASFLIASSDGSIDESEVMLIHQLGQTMGMASAHVKEVLSELIEKK